MKDSTVHTGRLLTISIVAALAGLLFGFDVAIITGAGPFFQKSSALIIYRRAGPTVRCCSAVSLVQYWQEGLPIPMDERSSCLLSQGYSSLLPLCRVWPMGWPGLQLHAYSEVLQLELLLQQHPCIFQRSHHRQDGEAWSQCTSFLL